jgi:N-acetylneuraminate synthase
VKRVPRILIDGRAIGPGEPPYVIAEISANHNGKYERAAELVQMAKAAGADAVKLQTYTPDTLTIDCARPEFSIREGPWAGRTLYDLYGEACTPWEWQPQLKELADEIGITLFSTPFDESAVDFLEAMDVPAYKVASFENTDVALLQKVAVTGKPVIVSTGMATLAEISESVECLRAAGCRELALLRCCSAYPAPPDAMHLRTIPHLAETFDTVVGLSDHTLTNDAAIAAVALGASIVEKHFIGARSDGGPDAAFSIEPDELKALVGSLRAAAAACGSVHYGRSEVEETSRVFRRSLFVVADVAEGELLTRENVRSIRPGYGLPTKHLDDVVGRRAARAIARGTPLGWELLA